MTILDSEIKFYKSAVVTNTTANGGKMSANVITSAVRNNVFPLVNQDDRTTGITRYRKVFVKIENDSEESFLDSYLFLKTLTPGDDWVTMIEGSQTDTQAAITGVRDYGSAALKTDVSAGATTLTVTLESSTMDVFTDGDRICIDNGTTSEIHDNCTFNDASSPDIVITLEGGDQLQNSYLAATPTIVGSCIEIGDIEGSTDTYSVTSSAGTYDDSGNPVVVDNIGGIEETWTITFTSSTNFGCVGSAVGSVGTGNITSNFSPNNSDFSKPYFVLPLAGWGGTWAIGDTLQFTTHPASYPVWLKEVVPAGADPESSNTFDLQISGSS